MVVDRVINYLNPEERKRKTTGIHFLQPTCVSITNFNAKEMKDKNRIGL